MRRAPIRNLAFLVLLVAILGSATGADARVRTTRYFTIDAVRPPASSSSALFAGSGTQGHHRGYGAVRLTPYAPGRLDLH